jgi:alpha-tubulin suppressor-like RCC1 family protein
MNKRRLVISFSREHDGSVVDARSSIWQGYVVHLLAAFFLVALLIQESALAQVITPPGKIAAGAAHTCTVFTGGSVKCWGDNEYGKLGVGVVDPATGMAVPPLVAYPIDVPGLPFGVASLALGTGHSCALTTAGAVKCWGRNQSGELGDNSTTPSVAPVDVAGLGSGVVQIGAGEFFTCALTAAGAVKCWGSNSGGQLGDAGSVDQSAPVNVSGLSSGVTAIAVGLSHACAITATGGVKCWGNNSNGQLGNGSIASRNTPGDVTGLTSGVISISAGWRNSCALKPSGELKCWGFNGEGQLGNGNNAISGLTPVSVDTSGFIPSTTSTGGIHSCALVAGGGARCWGSNQYGNLGDNTIINRNVPTSVVGATADWVELATGGTHNCARLSAGSVTIRCWGDNQVGQVGDGTLVRRAQPVDVSFAQRVPSPPVILNVVAGNGSAVVNFLPSTFIGDGPVTDFTATTLPDDISATCAAPCNAITLNGLTNGRVYQVAMKARNAVGPSEFSLYSFQFITGNAQTITFNPIPDRALSSGNFTISASASSGLPVSFSTLSLGCSVSGNTVTLLKGGVCAITADQPGDASFATARGVIRAFNIDAPAFQATKIAAGNTHLCATTPQGAAKCWGTNESGRLGDGTTTDRNVPTEVSSLSTGIAQIGPGFFASCATTTAGAVKCWGNNFYGQLGVSNTATQSLTPINVAGLTSGVASAHAGAYHSCALTTGGGVKCWGANFNGELGVSTTFAVNNFTPLNVTGLTAGVSAIAVGSAYNCAITASGGVKCWGSNFYGQLGNDSFVDSTTPVDVIGLTSGVSAITTGGFHTCALTQAGAVKCWGNNDTGAVGDGTNVTKKVPASVIGLGSGVIAISGGNYNTCALTASGGVKCWGSNAQGTLGNGSTVDSLTPVDVAGLGSGVAAIAVGAVSACALTSAGNVKCWGGNFSGQLGADIPTTFAYSATAVNVAPSTIAATVPGAPIIGTASAGNAQATVVFAGPASTGSSAIIDYTATSAPGNVTGTCVAPCTSITVAGLTNATSYTFTVKARNSAGSSAASAASNAVTPTAVPSPQTISFPGLADRALNSASFIVNAAASSGLTVSFSAATGTCSVSGNTVLLLAVGVCSITSSQAGNAAFTAATPVTQSFNILKNTQTITFGSLVNRALNSSSFVLNATASSGLAISFSTQSRACAINGNTVSLVQLGPCSIIASQAGNTSFSAAVDVMQVFSVTKSTQTISFAPIADRAIDSGTLTVNATASSGLPVSFSSGGGTCTVFGNTVTLDAGGICTITARQAGDASFEAALPFSQSFTITKLAQTISFKPASVDYVGRPISLYGESSSGLQVTYVTSDLSVCSVSNNIVTTLGPGICTITASQAGDSTYNSAISRSGLITLKGAQYPGDASGDGKADLLLQDNSGNTIAWLMNGTAISGVANVLTNSVGWSISHVGDFNGDGKADILWRSTNGAVTLWLMNGASLISAVGLLGPDPNWRVSHVGDFNGDGKADILWRNNNGAVTLWLMNGGNVTTATGLLGPNPEWSVSHVADVDGDGNVDLLWRNINGAVTLWQMSGSTVTRATGLLGANPDWSVTHTADLNGDGRADILWRKTTGDVTVWLMDGGDVLLATGILGADPNWRVSHTADFNGDGKADILWRKDSGDVTIWLMNGSRVTQAAGLIGPDPDWRVTHVTDLNGDGKSDLVWRNLNGSITVWLMNGTSPSATAGLTGPGVLKVVP